MNIKASELNFLVATLSRNDYNATEIHNLLVHSWGEESIVSVRRIQQIKKEYEENEHENFQRQPGSGRIRTSTGAVNVELVRGLIEEDNTLSLNALNRITGIENTSLYRILTKNLRRKSVCSKWMPHELSEHNKQNRIERSQEMLAEFSRRGAKEKVVVIDEKWVYYRDVRPKECNRAWVNAAGDAPPVQARRTISDRKVLVIVACNFSKTFSYFESLDDGGSVNSERYVVFLQNMVQLYEQQMPAWELKIQHDNARPHTAHIVNQWLTDRHISLVRQAPYSPDTNLMDRYVFRNFETYRQNTDFHNPAEIRQIIQEFFDSLTERKLAKELDQLKTHLQMIIVAHGDYVP